MKNAEHQIAEFLSNLVDQTYGSPTFTLQELSDNMSNSMGSDYALPSVRRSLSEMRRKHIIDYEYDRSNKNYVLIARLYFIDQEYLYV